MLTVKFDITGGNLIDRRQPRTVAGTIFIDVDGDSCPRWLDGENDLIKQMFQDCINEVERRLRRNFP